eukprot:gene5705-9525_t
MSKPFDCLHFESLDCDGDDTLEDHRRFGSASSSPVPNQSDTSPIPKIDLDLPEGVIEIQPLRKQHRRTKSHDMVKNIFSHVFGEPEVKLQNREPQTPPLVKSPSSSPYLLKSHSRSKSFEKQQKNLSEHLTPKKKVFEEFIKIQKVELKNFGDSSLNLSEVPMTNTEYTTGNSFLSSNSMTDDHDDSEIDHPDILKYMK